MKIRHLRFGLVSGLLWSMAPVFAQEGGADPSNGARDTGELSRMSTGDDKTPLSDREKIIHLLSRFSFGPTADQITEVRAAGLKTWFAAQLKAQEPEPTALKLHLEKLPSLAMTNQELLARYNKRIPNDGTITPQERRERQDARNEPPRELKDAVLLRAMLSSNQGAQVSADFFRNHFNVSIEKGEVRFYAVDWEREIIQKHALGEFGAMLRQSAHHPAMLFYLDNYLSRRPLTEAELKAVERNTLLRKRKRDRTEADYARAEEAKDIAAQRGLNENYARELLELHTLGVDNYYTQTDVVEVAKALTGWTFKRGMLRPVEFEFAKNLHIEGDKTVLGAVIKADRNDGATEGERILDLLIAHKGTARFLSWKLCRYFVADDPPQEMVTRVTRVWQKTQGNLEAVLTAIAEDPDFYHPRFYQKKFKRPFEYVVSCLRVCRAQIADTRTLHVMLQAMSEPIYQCEDPTGYFDQAEAWRDPGAMAARWQFAMGLALGRIPGVRIPGSFWEGFHPTDMESWKADLIALVCPAGVSWRTKRALDGILEEHKAKRPTIEQAGPAMLGLLLGSPEFQRQ